VTQRLPDAVLFDCDGTLLDSETVTVSAMRSALAEQGHDLTHEHVARMVGHPWPHTRDLLVELFGMTDADIATYREAMRRSAVPLLEDPDLVYDDVVEVLDRLAAASVPLGVVTSSGRLHLDRVLALAPLRDRFVVRVAREDTTQHKPSPVPYQRAWAGLRRATGRPLEQVTVVEDSHAGVAAGVAAGCWTVAVDRGAALHDLGHADRVVRRLSLDDLCES
jgi:HAD superfamily hydrolase (TIGR01509 family)